MICRNVTVKMNYLQDSKKKFRDHSKDLAEIDNKELFSLVPGLQTKIFSPGPQCSAVEHQFVIIRSSHSSPSPTTVLNPLWA